VEQYWIDDVTPQGRVPINAQIGGLLSGTKRKTFGRIEPYRS
jgi:hypothetical protein